MRSIPILSFTFLLWSTAVVALPKPGLAKRDNRQIEFDCDVPRYNDNLLLFSLGHSSPFPDDTLEDILKSAALGVKLNEKKGDNGSRYFYNGDRLAGYYDHSTSETAVFPKVGSLNPGTDFDTRAISRLAGNDAVILDDDTKYSIVIGSRLGGSQKTSGGSASPLATYLLEFIIQ